jgi:hypothetical protein
MHYGLSRYALWSLSFGIRVSLVGQDSLPSLAMQTILLSPIMQYVAGRID